MYAPDPTILAAHDSPTAVHLFSFAHSTTASFVLTGALRFGFPPAIPASCSSRCCS